MRRSQWIILGVVAVVAIAGIVWWRARSADEAPKYRTAAIERGSIESLVSATGTVQPVEQVEVGSQVSGTVLRLAADYNDRVRKGQVLCQLDPSSLRARAVQGEAAVARAEAALKDAKRAYTRAQDLIAQNYVSQADVDAAEVAVEQRDAELKQARAQLDASQVDLANATIRSPIDGVVIARSIEVGQTVAASLQAPRLFVIANDLVQMQVETRIDEADIGKIAVDQPVRFNVDAFPEQTFQGRVSQVRLEPITEQNVVTYTTIILTENPELKLRPGMTANVSVLVAHKDDVLKVPNAALRFHPMSDGKRGTGGPGGARADAGARPAAGEGARMRGAAEAGAAPMAGAPPKGGAAHGGRDPSVHRGGSGAPSGSGAWANGSARGGARGGGTSADPPDGGGGVRATLGETDSETLGLRPGSIYVLQGDHPQRFSVMTGLSDGAFTEVRGEGLSPDALVVVGLEMSTRGNNLQPPPGMGGFGPGPGGGGRGGGGGGGRR